MTRPALVLLTSAFPYGRVTEAAFLARELEVLADRFDRILVLPSHEAGEQRGLPANTELVRMDWLTEPPARRRLTALASASAARVALNAATDGAGRRAYARDPKLYADNLARNLLKLRSLTRLVKDRRLQSAIFYDYWFENTTLALALLRRSGAISTAVARAHRFDIHDEEWPPGAVPFRRAKAEGLDAIFPVSDFGRDYLARRLPDLVPKLRVAHLGVRDPGPPPPHPPNDTPVIMSCAQLLPRKCVHLIPPALQQLNRPVRWIHIGDGPERPRVEQAAAKLSSLIRCDLRGELDSEAVLQIYRRERVDLFVSMSVSEGLPVSMMEAQSFGVPVVARGVGGIPELVNDRTGVLLSPAASSAEAADGLKLALTPGRLDRQRVYLFFREHFEARVNYGRFADDLLRLHRDPPGSQLQP